MKKTLFVNYVLVATIALLPCLSFAQSSDDFINGLIANINKYYQSSPHDIVFVHTDRSVYIAGDELLFKVYVSDGATVLPSDRSNSCQIMLMNSDGEEVFSGLFEMNRGTVQGGLKIPDNLDFGRYLLLGCPYRDKRPATDKVFFKDVIISDPASQIMMDYTLNKVDYKAGDHVEIALHAYQSRGKGMARMKFSYSVLSTGKILEEGKGITDASGTAVIQIALPETEISNVSVKLTVQKKKYSQDFFIPVPIRIDEFNSSIQLQEIKLASSGILGGKLMLSTQYDQTVYDDEMQVVIGLFRKGLLYWTAPGTLGQTAELSLPVSRIPSGIVNAVVFDKQGSVLAETLVYNDRSDSPGVKLRLDSDVYHERKKVNAQISLTNVKPLSEIMANLSISVSHVDLQWKDELLIDDYFLVESELTGDNREALVLINTQESLDMDGFLRLSERKGYHWKDIISGETAKIPTTSFSDITYSSGIPAWYRAIGLSEFQKGIRDNRYPDAREENYKKQLANGIPVAQVLKSIKPYTLYGDRIVFPGGANSINNQQGALIVIDNQPIGEDFKILKNISPNEVESINVSTDPVQIQKYTGLNTIGVIEITTKGSGDKSRLSEATDDRDKLIKKYKGRYLAGYPDYSIEKDEKAVTTDNRGLLYWEPSILIKGDETAEISFYTPDVKGDYVITVQGVIGTMPVSYRTVIKVQ